jgi:hypothetical protein
MRLVLWACVYVMIGGSRPTVRGCRRKRDYTTEAVTT